MVFGIGQNLLRQTDLRSYLQCKRGPRLADLQLINRLKSVYVIAHRPIDHSLVFVGNLLQITVVRSDDTKCPKLIEREQDRLSYRTAKLWFCTSTEFVNE